MFDYSMPYATMQTEKGPDLLTKTPRVLIPLFGIDASGVDRGFKGDVVPLLEA